MRSNSKKNVQNDISFKKKEYQNTKYQNGLTFICICIQYLSIKHEEMD